MNKFESFEKDYKMYSWMRRSIEDMWGLTTEQRMARTWEDIENAFLKKLKINYNTYRSCKKATKLFLEYMKGTGRERILLVTTLDVEGFRTELIKSGNSEGTVHSRMRMLKKLFRYIKLDVPLYRTPYEMAEKESLLFQYNKPSFKSPKKPLTKQESRELLKYLREDNSIMGMENYAIVLTLVTTGMRSNELCKLQWGKIRKRDKKHIVKFSRYFDGHEQKIIYELSEKVIESSAKYFKAQFNRKPCVGDHFFYASETFTGKILNNLQEPTLWRRIRAIEKEALARKIISQEKTLSPMVLKKTFASCLYQEGYDLKLLQKVTHYRHSATLLENCAKDYQSPVPYWDNIIE